MDNNRYYDDEREIDLIDILGRIIAKWRTICTVGIVGLLIGAVISCTMGYINMKNSDVEAQKMSAQKAEDIALEKLLKDEKGEELKENADKSLLKYIGVKATYDMQKEYNENSLYQNMDANHIAKVNLTYYIDNHYDDANMYNNIEDIINAYRVILTSDEVCEEIISSIGLDTEPKYVRELVAINPKREIEADKTNVTVMAPEKIGGNLTIDILSDNDAVSMAIADCYERIIDRVTVEDMAGYGDVEAILQNNQIYMESDFDIMKKQSKADSDLIDDYNQLQSIANSMSGAQKDYFSAILAKHNLETIKIEAEHHGFFYYVSKTLILIAAIAAAFIAVVVYGVIYLFDGKVKTGDELASMSHSTLLGTVLVDSDKKKKNIIFDKWAIALTDAKTMCEDSERMISVVSASINQYVKANGLHNVMLVGADIKHMDVVDKVKDSVSAAGNSINVALDAFDSPETVNNITEADVVVFVGETCNSKYKKLERVLSLCRLYKKPIMGTIAIQERI